MNNAPKILPIESIFKSYANIDQLSLKGIDVCELQGFTSDSKTTHVIYKPFFLCITSDDPRINESILGMNENVAFFFSTVDDAEVFYEHFLAMLPTNFFGAELAEHV